MKKTLLTLLILFYAVVMFAQRIVFQDDFDTSNNGWKLTEIADQYKTEITIMMSID